jgi:hypothetical protein
VDKKTQNRNNPQIIKKHIFYPFNFNFTNSSKNFDDRNIGYVKKNVKKVNDIDSIKKKKPKRAGLKGGQETEVETQDEENNFQWKDEKTIHMAENFKYL